MTPAELHSKIIGFNLAQQVEASFFRNLYTILYNQNSKAKKRAKALWPLPLIDSGAKYTPEKVKEVQARNERLLAWYKSTERFKTLESKRNKQKGQKK